VRNRVGYRMGERISWWIDHTVSTRFGPEFETVWLEHAVTVTPHRERSNQGELIMDPINSPILASHAPAFTRNLCAGREMTASMTAHHIGDA
jgi:hypothetical protein